MDKIFKKGPGISLQGEDIRGLEQAFIYENPNLYILKNNISMLNKLLKILKDSGKENFHEVLFDKNSNLTLEEQKIIGNCLVDFTKEYQPIEKYRITNSFDKGVSEKIYGKKIDIVDYKTIDIKYLIDRIRELEKEMDKLQIQNNATNAQRRIKK